MKGNKIETMITLGMEKRIAKEKKTEKIGTAQKTKIRRSGKV